MLTDEATFTMPPYAGLKQTDDGGGDLPTHGTATNRAHWLEQGWNEATVGGCNTYRAASGEVT
jgi:predicted metalloprotease